MAEAVGLKTALDFVASIGWTQIQEHEYTLMAYALPRLSELKGVRIIGTQTPSGARVPIISFSVEGVHPHDLASILNERHITVRGGHFCAQPFMRAFGHTALARASLSIYNTVEDISALIEGIVTAQKIFRV